MNIENYRNVVIGSGEAGKLLAWSLARKGESTVVVERSMIGGSCPNVACLPSKNVIFSAKAISLMDPAKGLRVTQGDVRVDMVGVARRRREMIDGLIDLHKQQFASSGAELIMGEARFIGERTVMVSLSGGGERCLRGERVFINVGTRSGLPPVPGLAEASPMTHVEALELNRLPEHVAILGGGYIGLEFAQAMRRFGSRVTIIHRGTQLLDREDRDVADAISDLMKDEGVEVLLASEVLSVSGRSGRSVELHIKSGPVERFIQASDILVSTGRTPNTDRLNVDAGGVQLDARGYIHVDQNLRTSASGVWALGDCAGSPHFTHVSYDDFRVVLDNLSGGNRSTRGRLIPYCLFTDPELARVGLNEAEAKAKGVTYRIATLPMSMVLRTRTLSQTRGFCKVLIGTDDRILGFTALGAEASEMMAVVQTAMLAGMTYITLRGAIFAHPTAAEGLNSLLSRVPN